MNPSVKRNYIYHLLFEILKIILPFITAPYVSRVLEPDGVGIYDFTTANLTYFMLLAGLGTSSYATREIARNRNDKHAYSKIFWEVELLSMCTSLFSLLLWSIVIMKGGEYRVYYIVLSVGILTNMFDISWFFTGQEQVKYIVIRNFVCKILGVVCLFAFVKQKSDLLLYMIINISISLLGSLSMWTYLPRMLEKVDFKTLSLKKHFRQTLVYFVPSIASSVYTVLDKTLIGLITKNSYQNGYYGYATTIMSMIKTLVFVSVNAVMGARISYLYAEEKYDEIKQRIHRSLDYVILLAIGCLFGLLGVAKSFVPAFLGDKYTPVIRMLYLMSPLVFIIGISDCIGSQYYTPSGQRAKSARFLIYGSIVNLIMNLVLIPKLGAEGAIVASVVAETLITSLYVTQSERMVTISELFKMTYKRLIVGALMLGIIYALDTSITFGGYPKVFVEVIIGGGFYLITLWLLFKDSMMNYLVNMAKDYAILGYRKVFRK